MPWTDIKIGEAGASQTVITLVAVHTTPGGEVEVYIKKIPLTELVPSQRVATLQAFVDDARAYKDMRIMVAKQDATLDALKQQILDALNAP